MGNKKIIIQIINKTLTLIITLCIIFSIMFIGIKAVKPLEFNVGIKFSPDYFCKVEIKNSLGEYVSIFNNYELSSINDEYIEKIENNTIVLNLPELENSIGATLQFKVSNYTQQKDISVSIRTYDEDGSVLNSTEIKKIEKFNDINNPASVISEEASISVVSGAGLTVCISEYSPIMCDLINTGLECEMISGKGAFFRATENSFEILEPGEDVLELNEIFYFVSCQTGGMYNSYYKPENVTGGTVVNYGTENLVNTEEWVNGGGDIDFLTYIGSNYGNQSWYGYKGYSICQITSTSMQLQVVLYKGGSN